MSDVRPGGDGAEELDAQAISNRIHEKEADRPPREASDVDEDTDTPERSTGSALGSGNLGDGAVDGIGDDGAAGDGMATAMNGPGG